MPAVPAQDGGEHMALQQHLALLLDRIPGVAKSRAGQHADELECNEQDNGAPRVESGWFARQDVEQGPAWPAQVESAGCRTSAGDALGVLLAVAGDLVDDRNPTAYAGDGEGLVTQVTTSVFDSI